MAFAHQPGTTASPGDPSPGYAASPEYPAWNDQPTWPTGSGGSGATPPPPGQYQYHHPPVPGPGRRTVSLTLAVGLLVIAGVLLAHHLGHLSGWAPLIAGGGLLITLGVALTVNALQGRRQGGLGALAIITAILLAPTTLVYSALPSMDRVDSSMSTLAGEVSFTPTAAGQAESGAAVGAGSLQVHLGELDVAREVTIPVQVAAGNIEIYVPADTEVRIDASVTAGEVRAEVSSGWTVRRGSSSSTTHGPVWTSSGVPADAELSSPATENPTIVVEAEVGLGQIVIIEE